MYAEAAVPASKRIFMVFTGLSVQDMVKEFFRPQGLRSSRHGRKGNKARTRGGGIPDPNERVAKNLRSALDVQPPKYRLPNAALYVASDVADRLAWTVALLEMSEDLIYSTLLGVLEGDPKFCPNLGRLHRAAGFSVEGVPGMAWHPVNMPILHYKVKVISDNEVTIRVPEGTYSVTLGFKATAPSGDIPVQARMIRTISGYPPLAVSDWTTVPQGSTADFLLNAVVEGPMGITWEVREDGSFFDILEADLIALEVV